MIIISKSDGRKKSSKRKINLINDIKIKHVSGSKRISK